MCIGKLLFFVSLSLITGFIWGRVLSPDIPQHYSNPQVPIKQYDQMVTVDVIRNGDDIWIVKHKTGHLIFEYNRFKEADKEAFGEYEGLLEEMR
ncbi:MAG: hypothetical protein AMJ78_04855 [Omnitrophica WOR_2 bacterium SM23_29]|nr:MAG: hypothetical protein AMJ78_04855 [Omnitrophica WOR_2 bacterium SM23_29]